MADTLHVLVIDDSEDDRELYRRTLNKCVGAEYQVTEAADGEEGLDRIDRESFDSVLLDYSMPGRNGMDILKDIRQHHPFTPVVMMTGQGNEAIAVNAMQAGAQNYIAKSSISPESLDHAIRMAVAHCALEKRVHEQRSSLEIFTRALAHDLREPVRTIRSFIDLITRREHFSGKTEEYFRYVQSAADRVNALIDTVYFYTRLDGAEEIPNEPCDMARVLEESKASLLSLIEEKNATITSTALPTLYVNCAQLIQVLQNLLCNAIRHGSAAPKIHVEAVEEGDRWTLRVRDNGPGIPLKDQDKIFQPFKRLSHPQDQGLGLGLAICKKIIESHGGRIWYEETPGGGATFAFTVPKQPQRAQPEALLPAHESSTTTHPLATLLVVDDSAADLELTRIRLLERHGLVCNLLTATYGEEALEILRAHKGQIDLVLLDINMPEMDGFEVLEQIRADPSLKDTLVVMCTGSIYDKDMARARRMGAAGYLVKPVKFDMLQTVLEQIPTLSLLAENGGYRLVRN